MLRRNLLLVVTVCLRDVSSLIQSSQARTDAETDTITSTNTSTNTDTNSGLNNPWIPRPKRVSTSQLFHPSAFSLKPLNSKLDRNLTQLECEFKVAKSLTSQMLQAARELGDEALAKEDFVAAVAAYFKGFQPIGAHDGEYNVHELGHIDFKALRHTVQDYQGLLQTAFRFAQALSQVQLYTVSHHLLLRIASAAPWSSVYDYLATNVARGRWSHRLEAKYMRRMLELKSKECKTFSASVPPVGKALLPGDDQLEVRKPTGEWVLAESLGYCSQKVLESAAVDHCDPGSYAFKYKDQEDPGSYGEIVFLPGSAIPAPGAPIALPCFRQMPDMRVRPRISGKSQTNGYYKFAIDYEEDALLNPGWRTRLNRVPILFLPKTLHGKRVLTNTGGNRYVLDNSHLQSEDPGLPYATRVPKSARMKMISKYAPWDSFIWGADDGEWVKVNSSIAMYLSDWASYVDSGGTFRVHGPKSNGMVKSLAQNGYVVIRDVLPSEWYSQMRDYLLQFRVRLSARAWGTSPEFRRHPTTYMKKPTLRDNFQLHLDEGPDGGRTVGEIWRKVFASSPAMRDLLPGDSVLTELGAFVVHPGAEMQNVHEDFVRKLGDPATLIAFIALGDNEVGQGNLRVWPASRVGEFSNESTKDLLKEAIDFNRYENVAGSFRGIELAPLTGGSVILYDGTMFHQGTTNTRNTPRVVMYITATITPDTSYAKRRMLSILPGYEDTFIRVRDLVNYKSANKATRIQKSVQDHCQA